MGTGAAVGRGGATPREDAGRIWVVSAHYPPTVSGIGDHVLMLAQALTAAGVEVGVVTSLPADGDPWPVLAVGARWDWRAITSLARRLRAARAPVVSFHFQIGMYGNRAAVCFLPLAMRILGCVPTVTTFHDLDGPRLWGRLHRLGPLIAMLGSSMVVVCSRRQHLGTRRLPLLGRRVVHVPIGPTIPALEPAPAARSEAAATCRVVCHGFVWRNRGLESVVAACGRTAGRGHGLELVFAGGIVDAGHPAELLALADATGLGRTNVTFSGDLTAPQMSRLLASADIAVLPFPTGVSTGRSTFANCAVHGLPVVTTRDPLNCPPELVDGENVLLYPPGDEAALAACLESLCIDPELRRTLSRNVRLATRDWQWPNIARAYRRIFAAIGRPGATAAPEERG